MKTPQVSIIIPVYHVEKYVEICLRSVMSQTFTGILECIIVDDCGTDGSMDLVQQVLANYNGNIAFSVSHHEYNRGLSAARNTGIKAAKGDYLYFLDSDDEIFPDSIDNLYKLVEKYPGIDLVQGNLLQCPLKYEWMGIAIGKFPEYNIDEKWIKTHLLSDEIPMTAWNKLVSRQLIIENSLFFREDILHEDEVWRFFLSKCVKSIAFCFNPTYKYYTSIASSLTHKIDKTSSFCSLMKIVEECTKNIDINFVLIEGSFILKLMSKSRRKRLDRKSTRLNSSH